MEAGKGPIEPDSLHGSSIRGPGQHHYGRRGFLLLVAGGLTSLVWAGPVSRVLSPLTAAGSQLVGNLLPVGGWRIYTISGSMPIFDPASWRLEIGGLVERPQIAELRRSERLPKAEQVSTFHCVTGWTVEQRALGRRPLPAPPRPGRAAAGGDGGPLRLARAALRGLAHARSAAAPRRDARATSSAASRSRARTARRPASCCRRCTATRASSG